MEWAAVPSKNPRDGSFDSGRSRRAFGSTLQTTRTSCHIRITQNTWLRMQLAQEDMAGSSLSRDALESTANSLPPPGHLVWNLTSFSTVNLPCSRKTKKFEVTSAGAALSMLHFSWLLWIPEGTAYAQLSDGLPGHSMLWLTHWTWS